VSANDDLVISWEDRRREWPDAGDGKMDEMILSGNRRLGREALLDRAARAAFGFDRLGVGEDNAVALVLRNDLAFFEAVLGAVYIGAYAVPVNWHFTADEAGYIIRDCGAKAVVIHADLLRRIAPGIPKGIPILVVPTPPEIAQAYGIAEAETAVPPGYLAWDAWLADQDHWTTPVSALRGSILYTSGTTGRPKGVRRDPATPEVVERFQRVIEAIFDIRENGGMRTVITGPVYHSAPNAYSFYMMRAGGFIVLQPRFDAEELLRLIEQHRITHLHMVPTMFVRLLKLPESVRRRYDLSSLKFVVHAAAPCSPAVKRQMIDWWGPVINEYYGGTETGATVFHTAAEALKKPGTVGRPIDGVVLKVLDPEGRELAPNQIGEIYMRIVGFSDFTYHGLDEKRREVERRGLITVGDVGYVDEDGYVFLCDRARDMVISGGVNIYPAEIESVLITMPGVRDCAVFGIPDDEYGESLCAHVELQDGVRLSIDEVRQFLGTRIAKYKVPKIVEFRSELPREDSGKIFKRKLRAPYWEQAGRQI
jgi:long-chain acyl-CoA synthetase